MDINLLKKIIDKAEELASVDLQNIKKKEERDRVLLCKMLFSYISFAIEDLDD